MTDDKYALRYTLEPEFQEGGFTKEEAGDKGLCDAFVVLSIIKCEDGSFSQVCYSFDGDTKEGLPPNDIFKAWAILGMGLSNDNKLTGSEKQLVDGFAKIMRSIHNIEVR